MNELIFINFFVVLLAQLFWWGEKMTLLREQHFCLFVSWWWWCESGRQVLALGCFLCLDKSSCLTCLPLPYLFLNIIFSRKPTLTTLFKIAKPTLFPYTSKSPCSSLFCPYISYFLETYTL